jgi:hypothetical protein
MKHDTSLALYGYWQSCHRETGVPPLGIRAAELAPILPSLFLIELDLAAGLRFRFCGAAMATRYGRDLTDSSFLDLWNSEDRETLAQSVRLMASRTTGLVAGVMGESVAGGFTSFEMLLLPLAGEARISGAIGSMVRIGGHEEMNRIRAKLASQRLRSVRFLPAERRRARNREPDEMQPAMVSQVRRRYGHLTLVSGGK